MSDSDLPSLDALGRQFGTDKASPQHDYLNTYERFFAKLRNSPITLLEIGVWRGASLDLWEAYFPNARIIGADVEPAARRLARGRVAIETVDQGNIQHLVGLAQRRGPFDIVIDDGSHRWEHQIATLQTLLPFVKPGGIYIVEDLYFAYGEAGKAYRGNARFSCADYLKRLIDYRLADFTLPIEREEDAFLRTYGRSLRSIHVFRRACLLEKGETAPDGALLDRPLVAIPDGKAGIPVTILAHIGQTGDRLVATGCVRPAVEGRHIQGFSLRVAAHRPALQYRARSSDGTWTAWVGAGEFVGSRGEAADLTGFAVRLADTDASDFELRAIAQFAGDPRPVEVANGRNCISELGEPMAAMQIVLRDLTGSALAAEMQRDP